MSHGLLACLFFLSLSYIGAAQSDRVDLFAASACETNQTGSWACRFPTIPTTFAGVNSIQLTVKEGGRTISCNRGTSDESSVSRWQGGCDGDAGDVNFVVIESTNSKRVVFGSINVGRHSCQIVPSATGEAEIRCTPLKLLFPEDNVPDYEPPISKNGHHSGLNGRKLHFGYVGSSKRRSIRGKSSRRMFDSQWSVIDIMVVWTTAAECGLSNLGPSSCALNSHTELTMRGEINLAIAETNTAFAESGIQAQLRLVHAYHEPDYVEASNVTIPFADDLERLQKPTDGYLDAVHSKRALYGADMVAMIAARERDCRGLGYLSRSSSHMFSVTGHRCLRGGLYTLSHEISHNLGCAHDRGTMNKCNETGTYNYGYRQPQGEFMTIMSYRERLNQCDKIENDIRHIALRFSNPDILYRGQPMGTETENNARTINERRIAVAGYYPAMNCQNDNECDDLDPSTTDTCNLDNAACIFTPKDAAKPIAVPLNSEPALSPTTVPAKAPTAAPETAPKEKCRVWRLQRLWKRIFKN